MNFWEETAYSSLHYKKFLFSFDPFAQFYVIFEKKIYYNLYFFLDIVNAFLYFTNHFFWTVSFYYSKAPPSVTQLWTPFKILVLKSLVKMTSYIFVFLIIAMVANPTTAAIKTINPIMIKIALLSPVATACIITGHPS